MSNNIPLAICAALLCFGVLTIAVSPGFFMQLLAAGMLGTGRAAAYLILSEQKPKLMLVLPKSNRQLRSEAGQSP